MKKNLQSTFSPRQYMLSRDFEIYYYNDTLEDSHYYGVDSPRAHYYEFIFFSREIVYDQHQRRDPAAQARRRHRDPAACAALRETSRRKSSLSFVLYSGSVK